MKWFINVILDNECICYEIKGRSRDLQFDLLVSSLVHLVVLASYDDKCERNVKKYV